MNLGSSCLKVKYSAGSDFTAHVTSAPIRRLCLSKSKFIAYFVHSKLTYSQFLFYIKNPSSFEGSVSIVIPLIILNNLILILCSPLSIVLSKPFAFGYSAEAYFISPWIK